MNTPEGQFELRTIRRLIGVYNANGTVFGELAYFVGAHLGRTHCALCDITHGLVREKSDWQACRNALPVPFDTFHRNDQPDEVRSVAEGTAPVVVARTDVDVVVLLGPAELSRCGGSVSEMMTAVDAAAIHAGLCWPSAPQQEGCAWRCAGGAMP